MASVVAYNIGSLVIGGAETMLCRIIERLDRTRYEPIVWFGAGGELAHRFADSRVLMHHAPYLFRWAGRLRLPLVLLRGRWSLRRQKVALIHSFTFAGFGSEVRLAKSADVPYIATLSDVGLPGGADYSKSSALDSRLHHAQRILSVSARGVDFYCKSPELRGKAVVIHNGVDTTIFRPGHDGGKLKRSLGLSADDFLCVYVANFYPGKGHTYLIEAMALLQDAGRHDVGLLCVGTLGLRGEIEERIRSCHLSDRVFMRASQDVVPILHGCDAAVVPSLSESCSLVTLEAMACGLPVIVTDSFGPDLITDGLEGNIVPVENPQALAEAIRRLANNRGLGRTQGSVGRRTVEERFSMDRVVQRYMSLYDDVLESSAPAARLQVPAIAGRGKRP